MAPRIPRRLWCAGGSRRAAARRPAARRPAMRAAGDVMCRSTAVECGRGLASSSRHGGLPVSHCRSATGGGAAEHVVEHAGGHAPGKRVLLARVVAAQHPYAVVERDLDPVAEGRPAARHRKAGRTQRRPQRRPGEAAERHHGPQGGPQQRQLANQPGSAGVAFGRGRLVAKPPAGGRAGRPTPRRSGRAASGPRPPARVPGPRPPRPGWSRPSQPPARPAQTPQPARRERKNSRVRCQASCAAAGA